MNEKLIKKIQHEIKRCEVIIQDAKVEVAKYNERIFHYDDRVTMLLSMLATANESEVEENE